MSLSYIILQIVVIYKAITLITTLLPLEFSNGSRLVLRYLMDLRYWYLPLFIVILLYTANCKDSGTQATEENLRIDAPALTAPKNNSEQPITVTLQWQQIENVESYRLNLSYSKDFETILMDSVVDSTGIKVEGLRRDTTIYWKVHGYALNKETPWSKVWNFKTLAEPAQKLPAPKHAAPSNKEEDVALKPKFKWKAVEGAAAYELHVSYGDKLVIKKKVDGADFTPSEAFSVKKTYYWRVRAINGETNGTWSKVWNFKTRAESAQKLPAPKHAVPSNKEEEVALKPKFKWKAVEDADTYELHVSHGDKLVINQKVDGAGFTPSKAFSAEKKYYWRVRAIKDKTNGNWSKVWNFKTRAKLPAPNQVAPSDKEEDVALKPKFKWKAVEDADVYELHVSHGDKLVVSQKIDGAGFTGFTPSEAFSAEETYYWRVRAINSGTDGNWSKVHSFTTSTPRAPDVGSNEASSDRQVLMEFYKATGGDRWKNNSGWGGDAPMGSWYGIETDASGRVTKIDLYDNNLSGQLPASIGNLDKVTYFNVKGNHLTGGIPPEIGNMTSLEVLVLQGRNYELGGTLKEPPKNMNYNYHQGKYYSNTNEFSGQIPAEIGNLSNLEILEISNAKKIVGPIPPQLGNLSNLKGLYLTGANFGGYTIPSSIGNLTNLKHLYLGESGLTGELPESIGNLTKLTALMMPAGSDAEEIPKGSLSGPFPDLSGLTELRNISIIGNQFTGQIPHYFNNGSFTNLNILNLAGNNFTGTLPGLDKLPNLYGYDVARNQLTGTIDVLLDAPEKIKIISVGWNNLSGEFPQSGWPDFTQLKTITLGANAISGNIPCSFWKKIDNPALNMARFGEMPNIGDPCTAGANAMTGTGSIDLTY